jgi:ABC-type lipoprotein release transport system permease subunit
MWLKIVIVALFIALVISLFSSLAFLIKDRGTTMRTWQTLGVRLVLAALLMGFLVYGLATGQLGSHAPWDERYLDNGTAELQTSP